MSTPIDGHSPSSDDDSLSARYLHLVLGLEDQPLTTEEAWAAVVLHDQRHALELLDHLTAVIDTYDDPASARTDLQARRDHAVGILDFVFDGAAQRIRRRAR